MTMRIILLCYYVKILCISYIMEFYDVRFQYYRIITEIQIIPHKDVQKWIYSIILFMIRYITNFFIIWMLSNPSWLLPFRGINLWRIPIRQHILIINYKTILRKPKLEFFHNLYYTSCTLCTSHIITYGYNVGERFSKL